MTAPSVLDIDLNERLHVDLGAFCNNNCIFCMEDDRQGRFDRVSSVTPEQVKAILEENRNRKEVMFVSGEPTLNPEFLRYVRWAREAGFRSIGVISNGRRFSYAPFASRAVAAGLNLVIVSVHGPDARTHDGLTRTPGAFEQAMAGLANLAALARQTPLRINTSTVLNRRNATPERLDALLSLLRPMVRQMVFNVMQPFGRGHTHFDSLMMPYRETAQVLGAFFSRHAGEELPIYLVDIPYCTTEGCGIPDSARGYVERYVHFEKESGASGALVSGTPAEGTRSGGAGIKLRELSPTDSAPAPDGLAVRHRDLLEQARKSKRPECARCLYDDRCDGIWNHYIERFGFGEFIPVEPGTTRGATQREP
jgi:cyclic pyranopterin phosphate synthase